MCILSPSRLVQRDGRVVTNVEVGCDGRESGVGRTSARTDGEVVWSWRPDAGVKLRGYDPRGDGSKKARFPGRARRTPLKPIAQGRPVDPAETCGNRRVLFF